MKRLSIVLTAVALAVSTPVPRAEAQAPSLDGLELAPAASRRVATKGIDLIGFGAATDFQAFFKAGGWDSERDEPTNWSLERPSGGFAHVRMPSADDSVQIGHKVGPYDVAPNPILRMKFRIDRVPPGADISRKNKEDAAFRLFVVFDKKDGMIVPNTIGYAWTTANEVGSFIRSDRSMLKNVWYVVIGKGEGEAGQWQTVERDVEADYRRAFKISGPVPRIVAIGMKADTNDTHTQCQSALAEATLSPR
ncbi:MAG: DUF3047 domain-containing protein [Candidatus Wallbacteria bacterium]|nr:DUF3047 domain-containing protein [Candidatus Wallbacteria bacterium]